MAEYRYEARDMKAGTLLGDLPLSAVTWQQILEQQGLRGVLNGRINLEQRSAIGRTIIPAVPAVPGYVDHPGTAGNHLRVPRTTPTDPSIEWRIECRRPSPVSSTIDAANNPFYFRFSTTGAFPIIRHADGLTRGTTVIAYTTLEAAGFPAVGEWVQIKASWDAATDTFAWWWRASGQALSDNVATWNLATSLVIAGQAASASTTTWTLTGASTDAFNGPIRRWMLWTNGVLTHDINASTDITEANKNNSTFTATTGQTVTVVRTGSPSTTLVPTVPEVPSSEGAAIPGRRLTSGLLDGTRLARTVIWMYRDGQPIDGFIVWARPKRISSTVIDISAASLLSYFGARILSWTPSYNAVDQLTLARNIIGLATPASHIFGFLNNTTNLSGVLRDRNPLAFGYERKSIGQLLDDLAAVENGFEFSIDASLINDLPVPTFRPSYPKRGRPISETGFLLLRSGDRSGNIIDYGLDEDGTQIVTTVHGVGAGEGWDMLTTTQVNTDLLNRGWPLLETVIAHKDVTVRSTLDSHARAELKRRARTAETGPWDLRVNPDDPSVTFGSWTVGDEARVVIEDDERFPVGPNGENGFDQTLRIVGQRVVVSDDGAPDHVTLMMEVLDA